MKRVLSVLLVLLGVTVYAQDTPAEKPADKALSETQTLKAQNFILRAQNLALQKQSVEAQLKDAQAQLEKDRTALEAELSKALGCTAWDWAVMGCKPAESPKK